MKKRALILFGIAMAVVSSGPATAQKKHKMDAISESEAVQNFRDICVAHYLDRKSLLDRLKADVDTWTLYTERRPSDLTGGMYLESKRGEIGYINLPTQRVTNNDPACHFSFISDKKAAHQSLVNLATRELGLVGGRDTTSKNSKQVRWDYQNINGTLVRIFVSSGIKANGRVVSRLSISRHRTPPPKPAGQTI